MDPEPVNEEPAIRRPSSWSAALSQLPGIRSLKLLDYSRAKMTIDVVTEGRPVNAIDYARQAQLSAERAARKKSE